MIFDRWTDIEFCGLLVLYHRESFPYWDVCLGLFIILHLISFALYSNTILFKCYAVRSVLPTIISGLFCGVVFHVPMILAWYGDALVILPVCDFLVRCAVYTVMLIKTYTQLKVDQLDVVDFVFEPQVDCWMFRYHYNRRFLMLLDRVFDVGVVGLFIFYHLKSILHWPVSLVVCIFSRVISFALYCNTKLWKCYAIRTVLPTVLSVICTIALWVPFILFWINNLFVIVLFGKLLAMSGCYVLLFVASCRKFR